MRNGKQILAEIERHGGLSSVHTRPFLRGWANTLVCKDGWRYTMTKREDESLRRAQRERDKAN